MNSWYNIQGNAIDITGDIGFFGVTSQDFRNSLKEFDGQDIELNISSLGGDVGEAIDIYNALKTYPGRVTAKITGPTASSATLIASGADEIQAFDNTLYLIHNVWTMTAGNADEMRKTANDLDKFDASIIGVYKKKTGRRESTIKSKMKEEVWMSADEAKDFGLVDKVIPATKAQNKAVFLNSVSEKKLPEIPNEKLNILNKTKMEDQTFIDKIVAGVKEVFKSKEVDESQILNAVTAEVEKVKADYDKKVGDAEEKVKEAEKALSDYKASVKDAFETDVVADIEKTVKEQKDKLAKYEGRETQADPNPDKLGDGKPRNEAFAQIAENVKNYLPRKK